MDSQSFQDLIKYCNTNAKFISDDTIKRRIQTMYDKEKECLKTELAAADGKISFALDCWTSPNQIPFHGIVAQWIGNDFEYQQKIIDLDILNGQHTGTNLAESFMKVAMDMGVSQKILAITTDNASNCDSFDNLSVLMDNQGSKSSQGSLPTHWKFPGFTAYFPLGVGGKTGKLYF